MSDDKRIKLGNVDFRFPSYYCRYDYDSPSGKASYKSAACFGSLFRTHDENYIFNGRINIQFCNDLKLVQQSKNNYCPLSNEEIKYFLDYIGELLNFKYEIKDYTSDDFNGLEVSINLENFTTFQKNTILTFIRWLFEMPYNIALKEAFNLMNKTEYFKDYNIINLFIIVQNVYIGLDPRSIHTLYTETNKSNQLISYTKLEDHLSRYNDKVKDGMVNQTFPIKIVDGNFPKKKLNEDLPHIEQLINGEVNEEFLKKYILIDNELKK